VPIWVWVAFHAAVFAMLAIDLGVFHRHAHEVTVREAAGCVPLWQWTGHASTELYREG